MADETLVTPTLRFDHVSVSVRDIDEGVRFYGDVLGLERIQRPDFGFPGAWFRTGGVPLHLTTGGTVRGVDAPLRPNDPHFALSVDGDLDGLLEHLRRNGAPLYELENSPAAQRQTFVMDPSGNVIELCVNFDRASDQG